MSFDSYTFLGRLLFVFCDSIHYQFLYLMKISKIHIRHSWVPNSHPCCTPDHRFCSHGTSPPAHPLHSCCLSCFWQSHPGLGWAMRGRAAPLLVSLTVTLTLNSLGVYKPDSYKDLSLGTGWAPRGRGMKDWGSPLPSFRWISSSPFHPFTLDLHALRSLWWGMSGDSGVVWWAQLFTFETQLHVPDKNKEA